ncbi:regulator of nonsense transcripts 1 [Brachionus plicatilis]|uniref:Regulator of nonsense transcripts 1 n=1 Tax=Brachionus plicatilis TaxID=10195 RepID=A0A3M7RLI0_BRAPC|nr:regulator of nonsense transcripts 1 [Brachionus plicatilis]
MPGGPFDKSKNAPLGFGYQPAPDFMRSHDPLSYIDPRSAPLNALNLPIPVPMLMPAPPQQHAQSFFNANQSKSAKRQSSTAVNMRKNRPKYQNQMQFGVQQSQSSQITQNTQELISQGLSQNLLTQGAQSQPFLSQGGLSQAGLSQADFSQDSYLDHFQSQAEGLLSQDSSYQPSYFGHSQTGGINNTGGQLSQF